MASTKRCYRSVEDIYESDGYPHKKQAIEASIEDDFSEVLNPSFSPEEISSRFQSNTEDDRILEIPKLAPLSGIRKITIKYGNRKVVYNNGSSTTVAHPSTNAIEIGMKKVVYKNGLSKKSGFHFLAPETRRPNGSVKKKISKGDSRGRDGLPLVKKKISKGAPKRRDNDLHRLLFLPNGLPDKTNLAYRVRGQTVLEGYKQGNGILCSCCNEVISPSHFEAHAGCAGRRQPYRHIYTSDGLMLHDIALSLAKNGQNLTTDDDKRPELGEAPEVEFGGCSICKEYDFSTSKFNDRTVMICDQCQKDFHVGCMRENGLCDLKELPKDKWFCTVCKKIKEALQNLIDNGEEMVPASVLKTIKSQHIKKGDIVQWRIMSGDNYEHLPFLSKATKLFNQCFDPIVAGSCPNLIPVMACGRDVPEQSFSGMHCVVLIVNSEIVSAGLLRIFDYEVAELPLVGTKRRHQRKGYFQALFSCIERLLCSLKVENLVLPATAKAESFWTKKLGFQRMREERLSNYTQCLQLTNFKGTSMLEKKVPQMTE